MVTALELIGTAKRDHLRALEKEYQERWANEHLFEVNAPAPSELVGLSPAEVREKFPKWFGDCSLSYVNGILYLGHAFTISGIEFAAGYQRMLGKRVLFPHGFHVTGIPIKVSSERIVREMELFGPDFENFEKAQTKLKEKDLESTTGKAGKLLGKAAGGVYQFQILESIGVPRAEVKKFADPMHWLTYFSSIAITDVDSLGSRIDWRGAFLTTKANPYYDAFVRWQMNKLYQLGKIKFGERYAIYSPKDGQPCLDHDRLEGEGVDPREYTGIKMEVVDWSPAAGEAIGGKVGSRKVFLVAATLRPETMYGQTNCFVGTTIKYGVFAINEKEAFICTLRAARNMAFQCISTPRGNVEQLVAIDGSKLVGTKVKAPFAIHPEIFVLPMDDILATKGTGIVTSVPSDSSGDFQTLMDLRKQPELCKIDPSWAAIDPVPIITTPTYGDLTAPAVVKELKIRSRKDARQLAIAKETAYKESFYGGTMLVGEHKGESAQDAKPKVRESMIAAGVAFVYAEPEGLVISKSADECVVALVDEWYLDYGEPAWKAETERLLSKVNTYTTETRQQFENVLRWLNKWACTRTYDLGSESPWDTNLLIEPLSDSTIYMSYYTIARLLHEDSMDGSTPGPLGVTPEQMTDEVWEYIFCNGPWPDHAPLHREKADAMKHEFAYFYPFDIQSSTKDLIPNHLSFSLYNHVAIFPEDKWPLSMRANGQLMLNGKKMSNGATNSLTLRESVEKFGADATRLALADAGNGLEDANFEEKTANANVLRVYTLLSWCEVMMKGKQNLRRGPRNYHDLVFEEEINDLINITQSHYEATNYKNALKYSFYEFQSARDWYREVTSDVGMHSDLVMYWIQIAALLAMPIAPHFAEHIHSHILKNPSSIQLALWPTPSRPVERTIVEAGAYMRGTIRDAKIALVKVLNKPKGKKHISALFDAKKPKSVRIYVATDFPEWQDSCVQIIKESYAKEVDQIDEIKIRELLTERGLTKDKRAMPFIQAFKKRITQFGAQTAFRRALTFSERAVLTEILPYLKKSLGLMGAEVLSVDKARTKEGESGYTKSIIDTSEPGSPAFEYYNV
ncbi:hypothetical protein BD779DRAFT_1662735 [Infundibulicybe gibba]|nr:hypothetical protein BD779DRAFT_1662735 [Infundibulicybe gibba]